VRTAFGIEESKALIIALVIILSLLVLGYFKIEDDKT